MTSQKYGEKDTLNIERNKIPFFESYWDWYKIKGLFKKIIKDI